MKRYQFFFWVPVLLLFSACRSKNSETDASGTFEATEIIVSAQVTGLINAFQVEEGQDLKAGANMGFIDTIQLDLRKKQLQASIQAAQTRKPDVNLQLAALEQQIATARSESRRVENLVKANAANQKQLDDLNAQIEVLTKQLRATRSTLESSTSGINKESTSLMMQVDQINDQIRRSYISSPIDGTILVKYAETGELAVQGKPLFKVADVTQMILRVYVTPDQLAKLKIGQKVNVNAELGSVDNKAYQGTVTWISSKSEFTPKTIQTRDERANLVYAVKVAVPNDGNLKIGMYGGIRFDQ
ncbi:MAG TPA: HlyD family efflux transporter periplasmic adaptor subunit [Bacteroidales bacterium]|nr:HlyD family efflux transporter periplasmic adaptor subunit [Bacteroidales bacterium]